MAWIARITHEGNLGVEHCYLYAPTVKMLYIKLYKKLFLNWIECHIYQKKEG